MLEVSLRNASGPRDVPKVLDTLLAISGSLPHTCRSDNPVTLVACVSLVATFRKQLGMLLQHFDAPPKHKKMNADSHLEQDISVYEVLSMQVPSLMVCSLQTMIQLDAYRVLDGSELDVEQNFRELATLDPKHIRPSPRAHIFHRLTSMLMSSWLHMCRFRLRSGQEHRSRAQLEPPPWMQGFLDEIATKSPRLWDVVTTVMEKDARMSFVGHHPGRGCPWERYALTHFQGRLVPGCCYLGCISLNGVSEAALVTQLCSGCRRVRYCCAECQMQAWLEGGHSIVCGRKS